MAFLSYLAKNEEEIEPMTVELCIEMEEFAMPR